MIPLIQFFGVFTAILQLQLIFRASLVFLTLLHAELQ